MPELTLIAVFVLTLTILKFKSNRYQLRLSARIGMAAMLLLTAGAHVAFVKGMTMMLPGFVPYKTEVVYLTGLLEFLAAIGLLLPKVRALTGWWLMVFFILLLPANIYACVKHVDMENATFTGEGPSYLWYRLPLQVFFMGWVYWSAIHIKQD